MGIAPEWFYKGDGSVLRGPFEALEIPGYAEDGGEEAEIAGVYVIDEEGNPCRIGMAQGNEFSDHKFEKRNYLNLAGSKLRTCSVGPELVIGSGISPMCGARCGLSARARRCGRRRLPAAKRICATAWPIWSIITSSLRGIGSRGACMCISSGRMRCRAAMAWCCGMETLRRCGLMDSGGRCAIRFAKRLR